MFPCSIPFHGQALNITVESYCDRLDVGLIACRTAVPDIALLGDRLLVALVELQQAVTPGVGAPPKAVVASPPEVTALDALVVRNGKSRSAGAMA
jgi:diacylglycerol O-acyltransferase